MTPNYQIALMNSYGYTYMIVSTINHYVWLIREGLLEGYKAIDCYGNCMQPMWMKSVFPGGYMWSEPTMQGDMSS